MTPKELHIAIDMRLQHIASNRKKSLDPHLYDIVSNDAVMTHINSKCSPYLNPLGDGFEDTIRTYVTLECLKKTVIIDALYEGDTIYYPLPSDYLYPVAGNVKACFDKRVTTIQTVESTNTFVQLLDFPNSIATASVEKYANLTLTLGTLIITIPTTMPKVYDVQGKFLLINYLLDALNTNDVNIYWETYLDKYYPNKFIIVSNVERVGTLTYDGVTNSLTTIVKSFYKSNQTSNITIPIAITKSEMLSKSSLNMYYNRYTNRNCKLELTQGRLKSKIDLKVQPSQLELLYIKKPRLINYFTDTMCELSMSDEIISIALNKLLAMDNDPSYKAQSVESIKI